MAKRTPDTHMLELAKLGAKARLRELAHEFRLLVGFFPDLRDSFDDDELPLSFIVARDSGRLSRAIPKASRPKMSPAARKAASRRMTKYWAERRKAAAAE